MQHVILNTLYLEAATELFAAQELSHREPTPPTVNGAVNEKASYVSILGANGEGVAMSSVITFDRDLLIRVHPLDPTAITARDLEDWCRELNNQLVGRLKNKLLLRYSIAVSLGLPSVLSGNDMTTAASPDLAVKEHFVEIAGGRVKLALWTFVASNVEFHEQDEVANSEGTMLEGAVALF